MNQFTFNGESSYDDHDLIITETPSVEIPERDMSFQSVPGRSGDIIIDNGRFKNINVKYKVAALCTMKELPALCRDISGWLYPSGVSKYYELSDTYDSGYFRYAAVAGSVPFDSKLMQLGEGTLTFNCKPYKYSNIGQVPKSLDAYAQNIVVNTERYFSLPKFRIYANGTVYMYINNKTLKFEDVNEYVDIDAELMKCGKGSENLSGSMTGAWEDIRLVPGNNTIELDGDDVEFCRLYGRWRTI